MDFATALFICPRRSEANCHISCGEIRRLQERGLTERPGSQVFDEFVIDGLERVQASSSDAKPELIAAGWCQDRRMFCFPARATGVEQAEESADDPISSSNSKDEGSGNCK
jgi:hypothetical protein